MPQRRLNPLCFPVWDSDCESHLANLYSLFAAEAVRDETPVGYMRRALLPRWSPGWPIVATQTASSVLSSFGRAP